MVDILMATYNGEKYISEQIESILNQSYTEWKLYINDDCSIDKTAEIAKRYSEEYPDKIFFTQNSKNSGSAGINFFNMISKSSADIIMTCDQDDVWLKYKVQITVEALENETGPALVHTDLTVVDENCNISEPSMIKVQHIDPCRNNTNQLIVQNIVTGCTMAFNRQLADLIKVPEGQPVHDWYIAVIASLFGKIVFLDMSTVLYRQHGNNACGAVDMQNSRYIAERFKDKKKGRYMLKLGYNMAGEILRLYCIDNKMLEQYSNMNKYSKLKKLVTVFKYGIWKNGLVRKIGQIYFM